MLVAVVFHHHQPWYIDREGRFAFRWIFDHTKNYLRHLELIRDREDFRLTYNISPTLIRQWRIIGGKDYETLPSAAPADPAWQKETVQELLKGYRERAGRNIELLSQPYFHPIMPLLVRHGLGNDLDWQLMAGRRETEAYLDRGVSGMWSPECAFSMKAAEHADRAGFNHTVLDGSALGGSRPDRPYRLRGRVGLLFRDNEISNAFSFSWPMQNREVMRTELTSLLLRRRGDGWKSVVIALDGENWMNGEDHLGTLYDVLSSTEGIESATLLDVINEVEEAALDSVPDTSWATDHSFSTWEGSRAKDGQWSLIDEARDAIEASPGLPGMDVARGYLRVAEGSDYTYWDFDRPGELTLFGMAYASAARDAARAKAVTPS